MGRKGVSVWLAMLLLFSTFVVIDVNMDIIPRAGATTWYVDDVPGGTPSEDFTSIQAAIDFAIDGDSIYVWSGTYDESIFIDKQLTFTGEDRDSTIIQNLTSSSEYVVYINASNVIFTGFTVQGSGDWSWTVGMQWLAGQNCNIYNNNFLFSY